MSEVGVEIVKTEETQENGVKHLNINVSNSEVERNPDIVRLCADIGILEYAKPKIGHWIYWYTNGFGRKICKCSKCNRDGDTAGYNYCPNCGAKMVDPQEREQVKNDADSD